MQKVAIAGFGAIGLEAARAIDAGIDGLCLAAVSARDRDKAMANQVGFSRTVPVVALQEIVGMADIIVEAMPAAHFDELADATIEAGKILVPLSCGQLLRRTDLASRARASGGRIIVPTGALLGLDAVRAAAEGKIHEVTMVTTKPPKGLVGAPYLDEQNIDVLAIREPTRIFSGNALEGARGFPANVNVAAALAMAGIGPERTTLEIWADPDIGRNQHRIRLSSDSADLDMTIRNIPSEANPRTGKITAQSLIACLRRMHSHFSVGS
jgi:aspartate dehydrogenase